MALHDPAQFGPTEWRRWRFGRLRHAGYRRSLVCPNLQGAFGGEYFADLLVEDVLGVELKCAERLANQHPAQCLTYLRESLIFGFIDRVPNQATKARERTCSWNRWK